VTPAKEEAPKDPEENSADKRFPSGNMPPNEIRAPAPKADKETSSGDKSKIEDNNKEETDDEKLKESKNKPATKDDEESDTDEETDEDEKRMGKKKRKNKRKNKKKHNPFMDKVRRK